MKFLKALFISLLTLFYLTGCLQSECQFGCSEYKPILMDDPR